MIRGIYRDDVRRRNGELVMGSQWQPNTIVDTAWLLMAALLKNDPSLGGITYWAVGSGDQIWDTVQPSADPAATRLVAEFDRQAIAPGQIAYLNADGSPAAAPTTCIEVSAVYTWTQNRTLREFGLFGGDAAAAADSGHLINHVIHPRIDLTAGATLTRRMRFNLRPGSGPDWLALPDHWMGSASVDHIDGVGSAYAVTLEEAGVLTIMDLATTEPGAHETSLPFMKLVELRAKARLALRTAAGIQSVAGISERSAWEVLITPLDSLAADSGAAPERIQRLQEQISALQLGLDNHYLQGVTVGQLALAHF